MLGLAVPALLKFYDEIRRLDRARRPFLSSVRDAAERYGLSVNVLSALLWVESSFNPNAVGSAGEIGMGQMMPAAAVDVGTSLDALAGDAGLQIDKAAQYLRLMLDRADGDLFLALRAYNAGLTGAKNSPTVSVDYAGKVLGLAAGDFVLGVLNG